MAKSKAPSKHSRAARRATSPGIDTDKSLKDIKPPSRSSGIERPSVLAVHQSAGVSKKAKRGRKAHLSAKARKRQERGQQMAEAVIERTSKKVQRSMGRGRTVQNRRKGWDEINKDADMPGERAEEGDDDAKAEDKDWETDEEMNVEGQDVTPADAAPAVPDPATDDYLPLDDDEEIL